MQIICWLQPPMCLARRADAEVTHQRIREIDKELFLQLISLARFNTVFRQDANYHQQSRFLTYAAGREAGTAVAFASSLMDMKQRVRGLSDPSRIQRNALKNIVTTSLVGSAISGTASGLELAQNTWVMFKAGKKGFSPGDSIAFVKGVVDKTDALFAQRASLVASYDDDMERRRHICKLEADTMHRIRQQLLYEFRTWSCHSRGQAWRENTFYVIDTAQNFTRMGGAIVGLKGFNHPHLGGTAAISALVANSAATLNPIICSLAGYSVKKYQLMKLARAFPIERPGLPDQALSDLKAQDPVYSDDVDSKMLNEVIALNDRSERIDINLDRENTDLERLRRVAQQQTVAGPLIGLTSMPGAILGTLAFYQYRTNRDATNKMLFAGRLSTLSGQTYALIQTPATIIAGAIKARKLKKTGQHPAQLLDARLKNLAILEEKLRMTAP